MVIMDPNITKLRCPACLGNIAMDTSYYKSLAGQELDCPHCGARITIPRVVKPPPPAESDDTVTVRDVGTTQEIKPAEESSSGTKSGETSRMCPNCGAEVGSGDLVCTTCEKTLPTPPMP